MKHFLFLAFIGPLFLSGTVPADCVSCTVELLQEEVKLKADSFCNAIQSRIDEAAARGDSLREAIKVERARRNDTLILGRVDTVKKLRKPWIVWLWYYRDRNGVRNFSHTEKRSIQ